MKTRIIQTRYWDDEFVMEADKLTKYLYIYLLTNQYINISGIFQLHDKKIMLETGLTPKELETAQKDLMGNKKAFFRGGWVYVPNAEKNNQYRNSPSNETAYEREISLVPQQIMEWFNKENDTTVDSTVDTSVDSTHKSEIINNKSKRIGINKNLTNWKPEYADIYIQAFNKLFNRNYKLTKQRSDKLKARFKTFTKEEVSKALFNLSQSKFHQGDNDRGWKADPDFLIRSDEQVDKWLNMRGGGKDVR